MELARAGWALLENGYKHSQNVRQPLTHAIGNNINDVLKWFGKGKLTVTQCDAIPQATV